MDNITTIKVELMLKGEDAKFFDFICDLNKKEGNFNTPKEFIEFLFMTGFTFVRGQFIGSMMADMMNKEEPPAFATFLGKMQPMLSMKISPFKQAEEVVFDRVFLNGEPAEYKLEDNGQTLSVRARNLKSKLNGKWTSFYLMKQNKPIIWKGDSI